MWEPTCRSHSDEVHVFPVKDLLVHEYENCACLPFTEPVLRPDGSYGWVISHNAWDNRE